MVLWGDRIWRFICWSCRFWIRFGLWIVNGFCWGVGCVRGCLCLRGCWGWWRWLCWRGLFVFFVWLCCLYFLLLCRWRCRWGSRCCGIMRGGLFVGMWIVVIELDRCLFMGIGVLGWRGWGGIVWGGWGGSLGRGICIISLCILFCCLMLIRLRRRLWVGWWGVRWGRWWLGRWGRGWWLWWSIIGFGLGLWRGWWIGIWISVGGSGWWWIFCLGSWGLWLIEGVVGGGIIVYGFVMFFLVWWVL